MQNLTSKLGRLATILSCAVALGACNRAEYATLPKSPAYLGTKSVAIAPRPAAPTPVAAPAAEVAPAAAPAEVVVAAPVAPTVASAAPATAAAVAAHTPAVAAAPVAAAPAKLNLVQRLALTKVTKKINKLAAKSPQFKQGDNTASTSRIDGNLRTGIILVVIGLIVGLFNGLIGTIIALIGLLFLVLWLLDAL